MRTRSSRFFVILLHLVGVSQNPSWIGETGIVAVLPWPVALERIDLYAELHQTSTDMDLQQEAKEDTRSRRRDVDSFDRDERTGGRLSSTVAIAQRHLSPGRQSQKPAHHHHQKSVGLSFEDEPPVWLQDTADGSCLGPTGTFSDCGDATLWFVKKQMVDNHKNKLNLLAGGLSRLASSKQHKPPQPGLVFEVVDRDYQASTETLSDDSTNAGGETVPRGKPWERHTISECLDATASTEVDVQICRPKREFPWQRKTMRGSAVWFLREDGALLPSRSVDRPVEGRDDMELCLARNDRGQAILEDCKRETAVQFSFLRYRAVAIAAGDDGVSPMDQLLQPQTMESKQRVERKRDEASTKPSLLSTESSISSNLPENRDRAHYQASFPSMHPELKISSGLLFSMDYRKKKPAATERKGPLDALLSNTNPILLAGQNRQRTRPPSSTSSSAMLDDYGSAASKIRRMQRHPYLNEAKGGIWICPQTGLEYRTDLHKYLGWDRKERGRHTLTGVGVYRKGFVIKVYGIAFYISKRDVLADESFKPFASLTADRLRERPEFYELLRSRERTLDRTLLLKTNMQLSADTMRSSLGADWSYLTEEAKSLLVEFSTVPRPADEAMLQIIQSPENPSRCSCSQVAPPEYNADPECCARGTELVFTWTKDNILEVRLNGRLMETFARPDIAEGIFYEYLRHDDPISPELRDRVVDGFPFLLGPLAQVRGVNIGKNAAHKSSGQSSSLMGMVGGFTESLRYHAIEMAGAAKHGAFVATEHAGKAAKDFSDVAKEFAMELDRRRDNMVRVTSTALPMAVKMLSRDPETVEAFAKWIATLTGHEPEPQPEEEKVLLISATRRAPRGRVFGNPVSRWFGEDYHAPDEIGPLKIHPTINKIILALVHLYLLLLFIVSFPGSYSTRTKLVARRSGKSRDSASDSESDDASSSSPFDELSNRKGIGSACLDELTNNIMQHRSTPDGRVRRQLSGPDEEGYVPEFSSSTATTGLQKKSLSYFL